MKFFSSGACAPVHMLLPLLGPTIGFLTMMAMAAAFGEAMMLP